jgi:murein L,D-transpeptidase YafK
MLVVTLLSSQHLLAREVPTSNRAQQSISGVMPTLKEQLSKQGLSFGAPIFMRIFKDPGYLEVWVETKDKTFKKFKEYKICTFSGELGPKTQQGDKQSPEGFYQVSSQQLNPWSKFHLSFNLGYPNSYDRAHKRTGSALMVHGKCVSIGCFAMTDDYIDEIYALAYAAISFGQTSFDVHAFPFKLDDNILDKYSNNKWYDFWTNLKEGYDHFNQYKVPAKIRVTDKHYLFSH